MTSKTQLNQLKLDYAKMLVKTMDLNELIAHAKEAIEQNIKDWDEDEVKSEILDLKRLLSD